MQISYAVLLAALAASSSAQYLDNNTIGSCVDVDCPAKDDGTTMAECQVTNRTHLSVGLRTIPSRITEDGADLTWTIGAQVYDSNEGEEQVRKISKDFYLGTPPSLDLTRDDLLYSGCAIFLYGNELLRPEDETQTCEDVVGSECFNNLQTNARLFFQRLSATNDSLSPEEVCQRTRDGLNTTFPEGCSRVAGQDFWDRSEAVLLTGPDAPEPPSASANQSSTCHPTLPKSNYLTHVFGYNDTGTIRYNSTKPMIDSVNLVLTTFWAPNGSAESDLATPDSQLTCLWPVPMNNRMLGTATPSAAGRLKVLGWVTSVLAFATCISFVM